MKFVDPPIHGTLSRYQWRQGRCRCDACRAANTARARAWRARPRQLTLPPEYLFRSKATP